LTQSQALPWQGHLAAVLRLGLPLVGSHLAQIAIGVTDTVMLGWYGVGALAAGSLGASIFNLLLIVGSGFALAVMPLAAGAAARGDDADLRGVAGAGLGLSVAFAVAVLPVTYFSATLLFGGQDAEVAANAQRYLRVAAWGLFPALGAMVLRSTLSALERTRVILAVTLGAAALNVGVNWLLIFGNLGAPELGLEGAAWATIAAHSASLLGLAIYIRRVREGNLASVVPTLRRLEGQHLGQVLRLGWPIGVTMLAEAGLFSASAIMVGFFGETVLAAHGIAMQLGAATFMVHLGLSQVATVRAGRAIGAGDPVGLRRGAAVVAACSAAFSVLAISAFILIPEALISLFLSPGDARAAEILPIGVSLLLAAALFQFADGAQVVALGLLRGLQDTKVPMILAAVIYWCVAAPASYFFGFRTGLEGQGVWFGLVIGLGLAALALSIRFVRRVRTLNLD